jgi:hypothetical protein
VTKTGTNSVNLKKVFLSQKHGAVDKPRENTGFFSFAETKHSFEDNLKILNTACTFQTCIYVHI